MAAQLDIRPPSLRGELESLRIALDTLEAATHSHVMQLTTPPESAPEPPDTISPTNMPEEIMALRHRVEAVTRKISDLGIFIG